MKNLIFIDYLKDLFRNFKNVNKIETERYLKEKLKEQQEKNTLIIKQDGKSNE
jgi:hypothetical protein